MKISQKLRVLLKSVLSLKMGQVETDKATLIWDGEEELKEGIEVFVREEEEVVPAPDGEYKTEDGKVILVENGVVSSITDPEAEVAEEPEETIEEEEVETPTEPEVEVVDEPEETASIEDRIAVIEEQIASIIDGLNQIVNGIAALEERMGEVEGKLAKVEAPAADPIDDTTDVEETTHKSKLSYLRKK